MTASSNSRLWVSGGQSGHYPHFLSSVRIGGYSLGTRFHNPKCLRSGFAASRLWIFIARSRSISCGSASASANSSFAKAIPSSPNAPSRTCSRATTVFQRVLLSSISSRAHRMNRQSAILESRKIARSARSVFGSFL